MLDFIQTIAIIAIGAIVVTKEFPRLVKGGKKQKIALMDSSALIDGRVVELAKAGFVPYELAVPEFIVAELQLLADGNDSHKRERARFGLEVVQELQREPNVSVRIERTKVQAKTTDDKLVKLAKQINADLFTTDYNLNQVANIEGVRVLNVNELSHALRPVALPGEGFEVKVVQAGSNRDQGVGYMEDGTMIVIDGARRDIGHNVKVRITRTHQTVAGKMLFATKLEQPAPTRADQPSQQLQKRIAKPTRTTATATAPRPAAPKSNSAPKQKTPSSISSRLRQPGIKPAPKPTKQYAAPKQTRNQPKPKRSQVTDREASLFSAIEDMSDN